MQMARKKGWVEKEDIILVERVEVLFLLVYGTNLTTRKQVMLLLRVVILQSV